MRGAGAVLRVSSRRWKSRRREEGGVSVKGAGMVEEWGVDGWGKVNVDVLKDKGHL